MRKYGILTLFYRNYNYGGCLQAYALQKFLNNNHREAYVIKYDYMTENNSIYTSKISQLSQYSIIEILKKLSNKFVGRICSNKIANYMESNRSRYLEFIAKNIKTTSSVFSFNDILLCQNEYDGFIVGSDQVWNPNVVTDGFLLKGISKNIKKISYAASISRNKLSNQEKNILKNYIDKFDSISVREKNAVNMLNDMLNKKVELVLDPVFLIKKNEWESLIVDRLISEKYALCYLFNNSKKYYEKIKYYCKKNNLKMVILPYANGQYNKYEYKNQNLFFDKPVGPQEFVNLIAYADIVFTDSFHGVAFSSIMNTNFMLFKRDKESSKTSKNSRLDSILDILDLKQRIVFIEEIFNREPIDFAPVNKIIQEKREESIRFLLSVLCEEIKK